VTPICPYCRTPIDDAENRRDCSGCGTPHHADCYAENGGCTVFGCSQAPADEPKVTITVPEAVGPAQSAPIVPTAAAVPEEEAGWHTPSVLGLGGPIAPPTEPISPGEAATSGAPFPPPPPADTTSIPPPPLPPGAIAMPLPAAQVPVRPPTLAEMYAGYHPPKSRVTFILLGIFLGALGVHNFYAGYIRKAAAQLCLTLFTCFYASFVSWIWAIVEVCTVTEDGEGIQFS
jgi:TM2 domain-containing membrane protein YozV